MSKLLDLIIDSIAVVIDFYYRVRIAFWDAVSHYESGDLQQALQKRLAYLSWILIALAMFLVISIAHFYGFETLETEVLILLLLVGVRYSARAGL